MAAYYVVCESLANVGKHARATRPPSTSSVADDVLVVEVVDDGVGGADTDRRHRLCAAWPTGSRRWTDGCGCGRRHGAGTRVQAEIPCG